MRVTVLEKTDRRLVFEVEGEGHTLANILVYMLNQDPRIKYATYRIDHPFSNKVRILTVAKSGNILEIVEDIIEETASMYDKIGEIFRKKVDELKEQQ